MRSRALRLRIWLALPWRMRLLAVVREVALRVYLRAGGHSPFYDGIWAGRELDRVDHELDRLGLPRHLPTPGGGTWPLSPRQRLSDLWRRPTEDVGGSIPLGQRILMLVQHANRVRR